MPQKKHSLTRAFDVQSSFFIPIWRRIVVFGFTALWAVVEWMNGAPTWALGFAAIAVYLGHQFFIAFDPKDPEK